MSTADVQSVISLAPAEVYAALTDLSRRPSLDPTIAELNAPAEPATEGAAFAGLGTLTGDEGAFEAIVTALEPDRFVALGFIYRSGARLHEQWRLSGTPSGTLVNYHAELTLPGGLLGKLMDRLLAGSGFLKQREAVLAHVKARLEQG
jgi:Polyketide cyclase / dehydrase and lipid transport